MHQILKNRWLFFFLSMGFSSLFFFTPASADLKIFKECLTHQLMTIVNQQYENLYLPDYCWKNILRLIRAAKKANLDIKKGNVLILYPEAKKNLYPYISSFSPAYASGAPTLHQPQEIKWAFHVVLEADKKIFDLDLGLRPTKSLRDYFNTMFPQYTSEMNYGLHDIWLQVVPALDYETHLTLDYFHNLSIEEYPLVSLEQYLRTH